MGKTPLSLVGVSLSLPVGEAVSVLGQYLEFVISESSRGSARVVSWNALDILMKAYKEHTSLPEKYDSHVVHL